MTKEVYIGILKNHGIPSGSQEDNESKHSSKLCRNHLSELENDKIIERMIWPPQSSNLSTIELLWDELDRNVKRLITMSEKEQKLKSEWHKIDFQKLEDLLCRMPRVCKAKGDKDIEYMQLKETT